MVQGDNDFALVVLEMARPLVKDDPEFGFTSRGKIKAKGKGEMAMFFVEQA